MKKFCGRNTKKFSLYSLALVVVLMALTTTCREKTKMPPKTYRAELTPLNEFVSGKSPTGTAMLQISDDTLFISINVRKLPPSMMHFQHLHGFMDGRNATCATLTQDTNNDSIIDIVEIEHASGRMLVPFHDNPTSLNLESKTYPIANDQGVYSYATAISLSALENSLAQEFNIDSLAWGNCVVYIHGISSDISLPESVQSLPGMPANATLPIACGALQLVQ